VCEGNCAVLGLPCECAPRRGGRPQSRPHGTSAAYRRHYRHHEKPCRECQQWRQRAWEDTLSDQQRERRRKARAA
jgi:hypothetical protein